MTELSGALPLLWIEALGKRYGTVEALRGVSLNIARGELFVLLGGSGSGKTTLLRAIAGFERPDAGRILLRGKDLTALPPHRRPVNMMFQSYALFPHMSVAENIGYGLRRMGNSKTQREAKVARLLDLVRLTGFGDRRPDALSGGQRQRVALARALAREPALLLLDEPLSALDRSLREGTREELVAVQRRVGMTFVLVTHDQEEALTMASRIGVMRDGRLVQVGTPRELYERPADRELATFIGGANVLPAEVRVAEPEAVLDVPGIETPVCATTAAPCPGRLWLALRPERLRLGADGPNVAEGVLEAISYRGDVVTRTVRLPDGSTLRATSAAFGTQPEPRPGERVTLSWSPESCILLAA